MRVKCGVSPSSPGTPQENFVHVIQEIACVQRLTPSGVRTHNTRHEQEAAHLCRDDLRQDDYYELVEPAGARSLLCLTTRQREAPRQTA